MPGDPELLGGRPLGMSRRREVGRRLPFAFGADVKRPTRTPRRLDEH